MEKELLSVVSPVESSILEKELLLVGESSILEKELLSVVESSIASFGKSVHRCLRALLAC